MPFTLAVPLVTATLLVAQAPAPVTRPPTQAPRPTGTTEPLFTPPSHAPAQPARAFQNLFGSNHQQHYVPGRTPQRHAMPEVPLLDPGGAEIRKRLQTRCTMPMLEVSPNIDPGIRRSPPPDTTYSIRIVPVDPCLP